MRELTATAIAILFVTTLGIAVFALDDQQTAGPAPDAVSASFVQQLASGQSDAPRAMLSSYARDAYAGDALTAWIASVERSTGAITRVQGSDPSIGENLAEATVTVRGRRATAHARFTLVREDGAWRVEGLPQFER